MLEVCSPASSFKDLRFIFGGNSPLTEKLRVPLQDPHLRNLESRFALQQKIVEAASRLSNEGDLCKTVKKKRRSNYLDAMRKLEQIEKDINAYRIKKGKKPTQRASLILAGRCQQQLNPSKNSSVVVDF